MKLQLYVKTNIIGLCFANQVDRDTFWALLGESQNCAERFGERTVRFNPARATSGFSVPLEAETLQVSGLLVVQTAKPEPVKPAPPPPIEAPVIPSAPAPIEPIAIIPPEIPYVAATPEPPPAMPPEQAAPVAMTPLPTSLMPQIASVIKPPDLRSRAGRAWKASQQAAK